MKVNTADMIELLYWAQGTLEKKQAFIGKQFGVRVPRTSHEKMWKQLVEKLGREKAIDAVFSMVLAFSNSRLREILNGAKSADYVQLRVAEPAIVDFLFSETGKPNKLGQLLVNKLTRSRVISRSSKQTPSKIISPSRSAENEVSHSRPETESVETHGLERGILVTALAVFPIERGISSSPHKKGWRLEQVTIPRNTHFAVKADWSENRIEEYLANNWGSVDFGPDGKLILVGQQVRLKEHSLEKVDFLARKPSGGWVAIELKQKDADGAAFTQLLSYMSDLSFTLKIPEKKVSGILLAPGFGEKVLNAAAENLRVRLLRYFHKK